MNGAEKLIATAVEGGVDVCFTNPGTTEMLLVAALDSVSGMRGVLGMFEGVVTGAADGYGRIADKPAMTLLHLGPGFANGIANLHNARRARSPIVNLIGHHATWHRNFDPPLNSDVETLAGPMSAWVRSNACAAEISQDTADAIQAATTHPGQIATLVVPGDSQWDPADGATVKVGPTPGNLVGQDAIDRTREALTADGETVMLLGQSALRAAGLRAAGRIAKATGCHLMSETFPKHLERGPDLPSLARLPYFPEQAIEVLSKFRRIVLVGCGEPISFFGYPEYPSRLTPEGVASTVLALPTENAAHALETLADAIGAGSEFETASLARPEKPTGAISATSIAQALLATQPDNAIVIDEGVTSAGAYYPIAASGPSHSYLSLTGGAIGFGMTSSVGAAIAAPDRQVIVLEGDGSGLYTCQAMWTQARESLNVVNLVFNNATYRILQVELQRAGVAEPGPQALALTELGQPQIDWCALSSGFGVPSTRVQDAESLTTALENAFAADGPHTIEVMMPGCRRSLPSVGLERSVAKDDCTALETRAL